MYDHKLNGVLKLKLGALRLTRIPSETDVFLRYLRETLRSDGKIVICLKDIPTASMDCVALIKLMYVINKLRKFVAFEITPIYEKKRMVLNVVSDKTT
jgi:hypothetical protein